MLVIDATDQADLVKVLKGMGLEEHTTLVESKGWIQVGSLTPNEQDDLADKLDSCGFPFHFE